MSLKIVFENKEDHERIYSLTSKYNIAARCEGNYIDVNVANPNTIREFIYEVFKLKIRIKDDDLIVVYNDSNELEEARKEIERLTKELNNRRKAI